MQKARARLLAGVTVGLVAAWSVAAQDATAAQDLKDGPGGEAGAMHLRDAGFMVVGGDVSEPDADGNVTVSNQMHVEFFLPAERRYDVPVVLVHGGGGQAIDWAGTPDGRDGWRDYFVNAGFDVYSVDRPGYGRSPAAPSYGEGTLGQAHSGIIAGLAQSENWPGGEVTPTNEAVIDWLKTSQTTPYAGNEIAAKDISLLLDEIGPAILISHSAGGRSTYMAADMNPENVVGIIAFEASGSNPIADEEMRAHLTWEPALPADYAPAGTEACPAQAERTPSTLPNLSGIPIVLVASGIFVTKEQLDCNAAALQQAGAEVMAHHMPDEGFPGVGHFMMAETNNAETAQFFIDRAAELAQAD
ncbi:alpha/beta fold hydrolase [Rubellimicrobium rubrum]|nr:alpha/beta fold hydrolase [Rubellimicrobium rubrum]